MTVRIAIAALLAASAARANQLDLSKLPGKSQARFSSPSGKSEACIRSKTFPGAKLADGGDGYDDDDAKKENKLCLYDFYKQTTTDPKRANVAVCPKVFSTNPGLEFHEMPEGTQKAAYEASECQKAKGRAGDKVAKFKSSISCSYTPSILAYYHLGRIVDVGHVPQAVLRTMDVAEHLKRATEALGYVKKLYPPTGQLLGQIWGSFLAADKAPKAARSFAALYTTDAQQVVGALVTNPGGEEFYAELNGSTKGDRVANFQVTGTFKLLTSKAPLAKQNFPKTLAGSAQTMLRLKDGADLVVMDTILSQADRFGNLHEQPAYVWMEGDKLKHKKAKSEDLAKMPPEIKAAGGVVVKQMLLKDNDCGVIKENKLKSARVLEKLTHLSPKTYQKLLWLNAQWKKPEVQAFLHEELLFTNADALAVGTNLAAAVATLQKSCTAGTLWLDIDLKEHLGAGLPQQTKDRCALKAE